MSTSTCVGSYFCFFKPAFHTISMSDRRKRIRQLQLWRPMMKVHITIATIFLSAVAAATAASEAIVASRRRRGNLRTRSRSSSSATPNQYERRTIVGGTPARQNDFPSVVFLSDREDNLSCGGTLISPTVVLTAAHCEV